MKIPNTHKFFSDIRFVDCFDAIIRMTDTQEYLDMYLLHNSSAGLPYHGLQHMKFVVMDMQRLLCSADSSRPQGRAVIAGMFHDVLHSGGFVTDDVNISRALAFVRQMFVTGRDRQEMSSMDTETFLQHNGPYQRVAAAISCTLFDSATMTFPVEPVHAMQRALRDADLMGIFHIFEPEGQALMWGLLEELNQAAVFHQRQPLSVGEFVAAQEEFLLGAEFYTTAGKELKNTYLNTCLAKFREVMLGGGKSGGGIRF